jgi:hypothetical protein
MDKDKELLRELHSAVVEYFNAENAFRRDANDKTWNKRVEADRKLTITVAEIREYLKRK